MSRKTTAVPPRKRKTTRLPVCKPCLELKYCPYGILIEMMPLLPSPDEDTDEPRSDWDTFRSGRFVETRDEQYARAKRELLKVNPENDGDFWQGMFFVMGADPAMYQWLRQYDVRDTSCGIYGHICPVFFYGTGETETKAGRRRGRYIPRDVMLQVVRRDDHCCRICGKHVDDKDIQFDHIIPHSKGGPVSVENIRVVCPKCNRKKSNSLDELLDDR